MGSVPGHPQTTPNQFMQAIHFPLRRFRGSVARRFVTGLVLCGALAYASLATAAEFANVINVHSFSSAAGEGNSVRGNLVLAADGNFYGASYSGGASSVGAVFKMAPDGTVTTLHSFAGATTEGSNPYAGLLIGADGNFYGTTYFGGAKQGGSVYKVAPDGTYTQLASFDSDKKGPYFPYAGLVQTADGTFYGTTLRGGASDKGAVFKMDAAGTLTVIHEFNGTEAGNPEGTLVVGPDGSLYGTTLQGGSADRGTVYKITTGGTVTTLYSFAALGAFNAAGVATNPDGANPRAGLTLGSDGNFYGTAYQGGSLGFGTVFRMTPAGAITTLHTFAGAPTDGAYPLAGVTRAADGTLYGTTEKGGSAGQGSAWMITPAGQYRVLHAFTGTLTDGGVLYTTLIPLDGFLYGVSYSDSSLAAGTAFKLDLGAGGVLPVQLALSAETIAIGASTTLTWSSPDAASCTASGAWSDAIATSGTSTLLPPIAGIYTYILTCTDGAGVIRNGHIALVVTAPSAQPVDGGATDGGGALGAIALSLLASLAGLTVRRRLRIAG
jgi:uncharacterized repeat protein (TIGR03803 family)